MCGTELSYMANAKPHPKDELPPEIKQVLPDLSDEERKLMDEEWESLRLEVERRGGRWSIADLIEECPPPDSNREAPGGTAF